MLKIYKYTKNIINYLVNIHLYIDYIHFLHLSKVFICHLLYNLLIFINEK